MLKLNVRSVLDTSVCAGWFQRSAWSAKATKERQAAASSSRAAENLRRIVEEGSWHAQGATLAKKKGHCALSPTIFELWVTMIILWKPTVTGDVPKPLIITRYVSWVSLQIRVLPARIHHLQVFEHSKFLELLIFWRGAIWDPCPLEETMDLFANGPHQTFSWRPRSSKWGKSCGCWRS